MAKAVSRTLHNKLFAQPLPPPDSFKGQKVLVTGGTTGLGLAAAIHLVKLGASTVVITCRDASRGEAARQRIVEAIPKTVAATPPPDVRVMELDMSRYSSVVAFVDALKRDFSSDGGLDYICQNAGVIDASWSQSPEGWVPTLQVNLLSTVLLAQLLLPWMKQLRGQRTNPAHLTIVGSGAHMSVDVSKWENLADKSGGVLKHFNKKESFSAQQLYSVSKLLLQYAVQELSAMALDSNGRPEVILNTCCPGMVRTEIARSLKDQSLIIRVVEPIFLPLLAQTPEVGSRIYLAAGLTSESENGKFICRYVSDEAYAKETVTALKSETAQKLQKRVWAEIQEELTTKVAALKQS